MLSFAYTELNLESSNFIGKKHPRIRKKKLTDYNTLFVKSLITQLKHI